MSKLKIILAMSILTLFTISVLTDKVAADEQALEKLSSFSKASRSYSAARGFDYYKNVQVFKEPFPNGVYIVNGDTPIPSDDLLIEFYEAEIVSESPSAQFGFKLVVDAPGGNIAAWDDNEKFYLTYCVSKTFGDRYDNVVRDMEAATQEWMDSAAVKFIHESSYDAQCDEHTSEVIFDVRPVNVHGAYLARAFFPRYDRLYRNVLIDISAFDLNPADNLKLVGILRHELGHVLGFRHEHTRPNAGACFEDYDWVPLTNYDAFSVMHYPQCNGLGDWSLTLTADDRTGASMLYGDPVISTPTIIKIFGR